MTPLALIITIGLVLLVLLVVYIALVRLDLWDPPDLLDVAITRLFAATLGGTFGAFLLALALLAALGQPIDIRWTT